MLTVKIFYDAKTYILEGEECVVEYCEEMTFDEWIKLAHETGGTTHIVNAPLKGDRPSIKEVHICNGDDWVTHFVHAADVYVMNDQGQTISTHRV